MKLRVVAVKDSQSYEGVNQGSESCLEGYSIIQFIGALVILLMNGHSKD